MLRYSLKEPEAIVIIRESIIEDAHHFVNPQPTRCITSYIYINNINNIFVSLFQLNAHVDKCTQTSSLFLVS